MLVWVLNMDIVLICSSMYADGPFVMNHELEIQQAFFDYRSGKLQNPDDNPWTDEEL